MSDLKYEPVHHDHEAFIRAAMKRKGFPDAFAELDEHYRLVGELLSARMRAGMTQEQVANSMATTKSTVSRLEGVQSHSPSLRTLRRYAQAVGCEVEIRLVPADERKPPMPSRAAVGETPAKGYVSE